MKKLALLVVVAAAVLALAGTAQAKEIGSLKICGASGCNTLADRDQLKGWEPNSDPTSQTVAPAQRYYTVEIGFTDPEGTIIHHENAYWLPDGGLMRFAGQTMDPWWQVFPNQTAMYEKIAAGIDAFMPELSKVTVKGKRAADPNSYLRLFGKFNYRTLPRGKLHFVSIRVTSSTPNPWVQGTTILRYEPKRHLLIRPDGYFRLPTSLGRLVMKRASLTASTSAGSGGGHVALYAGLGAGGLAALAVLGLARRKKMH
jgi:hypothetical protein